MECRRKSVRKTSGQNFQLKAVMQFGRLSLIPAIPNGYMRRHGGDLEVKKGQMEQAKFLSSNSNFGLTDAFKGRQ